jgi:RING finger protein 113A
MVLWRALHMRQAMAFNSMHAYVQEWNERQKKLQEAKWGDQNSDEDEEENDGLPFACYICRKPWDEVASPVVTKCKHYFCEDCALDHDRRSGKCFVCEAPTQGIFNVANDIKRKVKQKAAKAQSGGNHASGVPA